MGELVAPAALRTAAFVVVLSLGLVAGCADETPEPVPTTSPVPAPTATSTPAPTSEPLLPTPDEAPMEGDFGAATGAPPPEWDEESREAAVDAAVAVMAAYARPDLEQEEWYDDVATRLSPQAALDYQWVLPEAVAATEVTGEAEVVDEGSAYLATVAVPTDVGTYEVLLSRQDGPTPWVVERIVPPEGVG